MTRRDFIKTLLLIAASWALKLRHPAENIPSSPLKEALFYRKTNDLAG